MKQYKDMLRYVLDNGEFRNDRTGTGTLSVFGYQFRHDMKKGFPLLTTKKVPFRIIMEELKWFLSGSTNIKPLLENNVHIWNDDAYRWYKANNECSDLTKEEFLKLAITEEHKDIGDLGNIYGKQWRDWTTIKETKDKTLRKEHHDQIKNVIEQIKNNPTSRRLIVNGWNVGDLSSMALPPCHTMYQFYVSKGRYLSLQMYQRSGDLFLGVPFNIASYGLLLHLVAGMCNLEVGELILTFGDLHIYNNLLPQVITQLQRDPKALPELVIRQDLRILEDIADFETSSISLIGYYPHPVIKGKLSVGEGK